MFCPTTVRGVARDRDQRHRRLARRADVGEVVAAHHARDLAGGDVAEGAVGVQRAQPVRAALEVDQAQRRRVDRAEVPRAGTQVRARAGGGGAGHARGARRQHAETCEHSRHEHACARQQHRGRPGSQLPPTSCRRPRQVQEYLQGVQLGALLHCYRGYRQGSGGDYPSSSIGGSSNGRTSGFGPENRGSSPCPPAANCGPPRDERRAGIASER
jgi:hypothetical protein